MAGVRTRGVWLGLDVHWSLASARIHHAASHPCGQLDDGSSPHTGVCKPALPALSDPGKGPPQPIEWRHAPPVQHGFDLSEGGVEADVQRGGPRASRSHKHCDRPAPAP